MSQKILKREFEINVGCVDSLIRIFVGLVFLCGALIGLIGMWGLAGGVFVVTGLARYSVVYTVFKLNTNHCKAEGGH